MRALKWVLLGLGSIVALAVVGVLVIVWFVDPNRFKPRIEAAVKDATGRDFSLEGDIKLGFVPWLALRAGAGHLGNAADFGPEPMLTWQSAQLGAKLFPLLRGELIVDRVRLSGGDMRLARHADGRANWEGLLREDPKAASPRERLVGVAGVEIADSRISFGDESAPRRVAVTAFNLTTDEIAPGEPLTDTEISGVLHMDGFIAAGVPFRIAIPRATLARDYSKIEVKEYEIAFGDLTAAGGVGGTLGAKPRLAGAIKTNEFDPRALLAAVGIEAPKTTDAKALGKFGIEGAWVFEGGAIGIEPFALTLDDTHFTGKFQRSAGDDAIGEFALRADRLDIARYIPPTDPAAKPFVLPTAALKALKFRGQLELGEATLDDIVMKGVTVRLLLDDHGLRSETRP